MPLDNIIVNLEFGYTDSQGVNHSNVVFRRRTMSDDIALKADQTVQELAKSKATIQSPNQVISFQAITEWRQFNLVSAKLLLVTFGFMNRQTALNEQVFEKLTTSDVERIIDALSSPGEPVIPLSLIEKLAGEVEIPDDKIAALHTHVMEFLGNLIPTSEPSER